MSNFKNNNLSIHIMLSSVDPRYSSRIMKMCEGALDQNLVNDIVIYGLQDNGYVKEQPIRNNFKIVRINLLLRSIRENKIFNKIYRLVLIRKFIAFLSYIQLAFILLSKAYKTKPRFVHCHHLATLPTCVMLSSIIGAKLIYEPHELETECVGKAGKKYYKIMERLFIPYADKVILVCAPIRDWYINHYKLNNTFVIRNIPTFNSVSEPTDNDIFRNAFAIPQKDIIYIYQGILNGTRGVSELLNCFKHVDRDKHIVFMGFGTSVDEIKTASQLHSNIHFHDGVQIGEIMKYTSSADVGIFYLSNYIDLSYRYSLSNKFFEFLKSGIPIVFSDTMEYCASLINTNDCGWVVDKGEQYLINLIQSITKNDIMLKREKVFSYNKQLNWEKEKEILIEILN